MISPLLPTKAKTIERRVSELLNAKYREKHSVHFWSIKPYDAYPEVHLKDGYSFDDKLDLIRELNGGLEFVNHNIGNGQKSYLYVANLIDEKKKRVITFSYPLSAPEFQHLL
jgi:hypothetical protein